MRCSRRSATTALNSPMFRPPAEADSVILQIDRGCPYNRCTFCGMYRDVVFERRPLDVVKAIIADEAAGCPDAGRVFLADGDAMRRPFEELVAILKELSVRFRRLARVNVYATGRAIQGKTDEQLRALKVLKLHTLYMGLESGDEATLRRVRKAETADEMVEAGRRAQEAGLRMSVMVLLGLGGEERTREHAETTAAALNRMQPRLLSALRVVPIPGTELYDELKAGRFRQLTEVGAVDELRRLMAWLELTNTVFRANHASNIVPLEGRLPRDRDRLLCELQALLDSANLDGLSPGPMPLWL